VERMSASLGGRRVIGSQLGQGFISRSQSSSPGPGLSASGKIPPDALKKRKNQSACGNPGVHAQKRKSAPWRENGYPAAAKAGDRHRD